MARARAEVIATAGTRAEVIATAGTRAEVIATLHQRIEALQQRRSLREAIRTQFYDAEDPVRGNARALIEQARQGLPVPSNDNETIQAWTNQLKRLQRAEKRQQPAEAQRPKLFEPVKRRKPKTKQEEDEELVANVLSTILPGNNTCTISPEKMM